MGIHVSTSMILQKLRFKPFLLLILILGGCSSSDTPPEADPRFLSAPVITVAPDPDTPLSARLTVNTNVDTHITVILETDDQSQSIEFSNVAQSHSLPLLGLRPAKSYTAEVTAIMPTGEQRSANLAFSTASLPAEFPEISITADTALSEPGYTLINTLAHGAANIAYGELILIVNAQGEVVWYHRAPRFLDVRQLPNRNILAQEGSSLVELDMLGNHVNEWTPTGTSGYIGPDISVDTGIFHHEVYPMANGNFIALSIEARNYDNYPLDETNLAITGNANIAGDVVVEFSPDGTIVNEWPLLDMLDPYRIGYDSLGSYWDFFYGAATDTKDWAHANAVVYDATDDSIIVCLRHQDALVKFSRQTGNLIWILGPPENWTAPYDQYLLTPVAAQQAEPYFYSYHPHAHMVLPNGNILVYDNGNWRASPTANWVMPADNFSRAVEYAINEQTGEAEIVWEHGFDDGIFSGFLGDADQLPQTGNILITHGTLTDVNGKYWSKIIEVTHESPATEVFTMSVSDASNDNTRGWRVYRSERIADLYDPSVATVTDLTP